MNHRLRWGLSVIEAHRADGSTAFLFYERPSVVASWPPYWTVGRVLRTLAAGTLIGLGAWLVTSGLLVVGGPS